jgi:hypothetical protein
VGAVDSQAEVEHSGPERSRVGIARPVGQDLEHFGPETTGDGEVDFDVTPGESIGDHGPEGTADLGCYHHEGSILAPLAG